MHSSEQHNELPPSSLIAEVLQSQLWVRCLYCLLYHVFWADIWTRHEGGTFYGDISVLKYLFHPPFPLWCSTWMNPKKSVQSPWSYKVRVVLEIYIYRYFFFSNANIVSRCFICYHKGFVLTIPIFVHICWTFIVRITVINKFKLKTSNPQIYTKKYKQWK